MGERCLSDRNRGKESRNQGGWVQWKELKMPNEVLLIGVGPKGRQSLTEETLKLLTTSQTVIGGKKLLSQFRDIPGKTVTLPSDLSKVLKILKDSTDET